MSKVPESRRERRGRSGATGPASLGRNAGGNIKRILVEANFSEAERRAVGALCDGPHSARGLARLLGLSHFIKANQLVGCAARKVFDVAPRNPFIRKWRSEDDYGVGVIAAARRFENDKNCYWEIRPEVKQAFMDLGWYPSPDYAPTADEGKLEARVSKLRKRGITTPPAGQEKPATVATTSQTYVRDPQVKAWVLENAQGKCEGCGDPAPFTDNDGEPFLEDHHVRALADGGSDKITNAVALCPNCHRRCHLGAAHHLAGRKAVACADCATVRSGDFQAHFGSPHDGRALLPPGDASLARSKSRFFRLRRACRSRFAFLRRSFLCHSGSLDGVEPNC